MLWNIVWLALVLTTANCINRNPATVTYGPDEFFLNVLALSPADSSSIGLRDTIHVRLGYRLPLGIAEPQDIHLSIAYGTDPRGGTAEVIDYIPDYVSDTADYEIPIASLDHQPVAGDELWVSFDFSTAAGGGGIIHTPTFHYRVVQEVAAYGAQARCGAK